jgi:hypothetical protein
LGWRRLPRLPLLRLGGRARSRLPLRLAVEPVGGRHERYVGHRFRRELHDPGLDLRVDAAEQRLHIEIEERAVGGHHPVGLRPWRQREQGTLL